MGELAKAFFFMLDSYQKDRHNDMGDFELLNNRLVNGCHAPVVKIVASKSLYSISFSLVIKQK